MTYNVSFLAKLQQIKKSKKIEMKKKMLKNRILPKNLKLT